MIIDDARAVRQVVGMTLQECEYGCIEAENGQDALDKLDGSEIDMFIVDINMPVMDGITFLKTLKNNDKYSSFKFTPFLFLTTEAGTDIKEKCKEHGASAWMVKPFHPDQLIDKIKMLIV